LLGDQFQQRLLAGVAYDPKRLPAAVSDLAQAERNTSELNYQPKKHRAGMLSEFGKLVRLKITSATDEIVREAAALPQLEVLFLEAPRLTEVSALAGAPRLSTLGVRNPKGLVSLESFSVLRQLRVLALMNAPQVSDLGPVGELTGLEAFAADGANEKNWKIDSLAPLRTLKRLRQLFITATEVRDAKLAPLAELPQLRVLYCPSDFPTEQFDKIRELGSIEAYTLRMFGPGSTKKH
jgi:hypothetical protein